MSHLDEGQLHELLDGELDEPTRAAALAHLAACERCKAQYDEAAAFLAEADALIDAVQLPARPVAQPQQEAVRPSATGHRLRRYRTLAWAASLVLAVGLGWYGSDLRRATQETELQSDAAPSVMAEAPVVAPTPVVEGKATATPTDQDAPAAVTRAKENVPASIAAAEPRRDAQADRGAAAAPAPPSAEARQADKPAQGFAGVAQPQPAAAPVSPSASGSAERDESVRLRTLDDRNTVTAEQALGGLATRKVAPPGLTGFRQIEMEEAVRTLGGSIRLIDGMTPERLLAGSVGQNRGDDLSTVVRVVYQDPPGRELWLDQKRSSVLAREERRAGAATTLLPGDTLVTTGADGARSLTWLDQAGFQLRLTGFLPPDSLRALRDQIR